MIARQESDIAAPIILYMICICESYWNSNGDIVELTLLTESTVKLCLKSWQTKQQILMHLHHNIADAWYERPVETNTNRDGRQLFLLTISSLFLAQTGSHPEWPHLHSVAGKAMASMDDEVWHGKDEPEEAPNGFIVVASIRGHGTPYCQHQVQKAQRNAQAQGQGLVRMRLEMLSLSGLGL